MNLQTGGHADKWTHRQKEIYTEGQNDRIPPEFMENQGERQQGIMT